MDGVFQGSLLDLDTEIGPGPLGATVRRTPLAHGAWIDVRRGWMGGADALFERLADTVPWHAERRKMYDRVVDVPRLLKFYDEGEPLPDPALDAAMAALNEHYGPELGEPFRTVGLCFYRDGRDSVAWHGDRIGRGGTEDTMVAIVSVGTPAPCSCAPPAAEAPRSATTSDTATSSSWAAVASAPGNTPSPRPAGPRAPASASSTAHAESADGAALSPPPKA
ncbi:alpha-ketoglutarate-dependent dioxygenase AlkB family protein [Thermocatellispora tengchongensis]|uniref:alpha-ketoglutarate-dependent dioxygenase AlkB n=1 Tax=Thermocatellispora tengchongensis TaxID=1073253 RepID=UPI0036350527